MVTSHATYYWRDTCFRVSLLLPRPRTRRRRRRSWLFSWTIKKYKILLLLPSGKRRRRRMKQWLKNTHIYCRENGRFNDGRRRGRLGRSHFLSFFLWFDFLMQMEEESCKQMIRYTTANAAAITCFFSIRPISICLPTYIQAEWRFNEPTRPHLCTTVNFTLKFFVSTEMKSSPS